MVLHWPISSATPNEFALPVAQALYDKLWGQSLDTIFEDISDNLGKNMKYVLIYVYIYTIRISATED